MVCKDVSRRRFLKACLGLALTPTLLQSIGQAKPVIGFYSTPVNVLLPETPSMARGRPGSILKLIVAAIILEENLPAAQTTYECRGIYYPDGPKGLPLHCQVAHGNVDLLNALGVSCNGFFASAAKTISSQRILETWNAFSQQKIKFAQAPSWLLALGMADCLSSASARDLLVVAQTIALETLPGYKPSTWQTLKQGMRLVGRIGTGKALDPHDQFKVALKTGTVPKYDHGYESWVMGFFPVDKPCYVFCQRAPNGTSQDVAVPLAHQALFSRSWP